MKNFRTYELALAFYQGCEKKPIKNKILRDQFQRASLSIVLNLAEGSGKPTAKDRKRFYSIVMGSLRETQTLLKILNWKAEINTADKLGAYMHNLIKNTGGS